MGCPSTPRLAGDRTRNQAGALGRSRTGTLSPRADARPTGPAGRTAPFFCRREAPEHHGLP